MKSEKTGKKIEKIGVKNSKKTNAYDYDPHAIQSHWQSVWQKEKTYQVDLDSAKRPFYNLMMFPYPSAEGLHVGSFFTYGGIDAFGRFKRMQGYDVFEPIGLDGFGIHSENYAIKVGRTPQEHARISEENFYRQLHLLGNGYDWSRKLETYDPAYYKWTQWLFIELFKAGLAYKAEASVNFCPSCKTVLSDEQVIDGKCERCSSEVEKRDLSQWFFRITDYAERLLANTETLDWSTKVKIAQKNWIGKSEGVNIVWKHCTKDGKETGEEIITFTTRKDTLPGVTFLVLAPESEYVQMVTTAEHAEGVKTYVAEAASTPIAEKEKKKSGVFTGSYAKNPFTDAVVPIYIADYVLGGYGTGAVMGMPGHDTRDREFAALFGLPCILTTQLPEGMDKDEVYTGPGKQINTGDGYDGLSNKEAADKILAAVEKKNMAQKTTQYHLRDWLISRQRYWGPPIPMIHCESCNKAGKSWFTESGAAGSVESRRDPIASLQDDKSMAGWYPVAQEQLPVLLPVVSDFKPLGTGRAPLANYPEFYETTCPGCGGQATRETDVSDTFLDSAWYFFRYLATDSSDTPFPMKSASVISSEARDPKQSEHEISLRQRPDRNDKLEDRLKWLPVTSYIGGAEHAVLHLLYSRFVTMVLKDLGYIDFEEPYAKFRANGLIIKDGAKMSKSKGNVINPDDYIKKYGSDTLRTYLGFVGPFTQGGDFQDTGIEGINRFLIRVWKLVKNNLHADTPMSSQTESLVHQTIKGYAEDMEELRFNTAISKGMILYNHISNEEKQSKFALQVLLQVLAPFAPHMTEELWHQMGNSTSIHLSQWPHFDPEKIISDTVTIAIQVNGKLRETLVLPSSKINEKNHIEATAKEQENVKRFLENMTIRKVIYVPGKILNFVV